MQRGLVGSEMCIRDRYQRRVHGILVMSTVILFISSGDILILTLLLMGIFMHAIQVWWFFILIPSTINTNYYSINLGVLGGGMLAIGSILGVCIMKVFAERQLWIDVILHPFVIEFGTFLMANIFILYYVFQNRPTKNYFFYYSRIPYAPLSQAPSIEMTAFQIPTMMPINIQSCLLYTSDAADDTPCVDLGGRRIIKKKK
eukprot:TRINITY_DN66547_c0_g1_i1.p1 TRINITY_DN66547_c0_g1~~TRINITY_DN66547_c0_g1_i1.p1  ORF type:complete len:201 (+),score=38.81 TRINITY_DN66547_c0_g1_i1:124-726(+)